MRPKHSAACPLCRAASIAPGAILGVGGKPAKRQRLAPQRRRKVPQRRVDRGAGQRLHHLDHFQRVAGGGGEGLAHVGDEGRGHAARALRVSRPARGPAPRRRPCVFMKAPEPDLDVEHEAFEAGGELLRQDRGGDQIDAFHRAGHVADGVEAAVGGGDAGRWPRRWRSAMSANLGAKLVLGERRCGSRGSPRACRACRRCGRGRGPRSSGHRRRMPASAGARRSDTQSPMPPVECLSRTGPGRSQCRTWPLSRMARVRATRARLAQPAAGRRPWRRRPPAHPSRRPRRGRGRTIRVLRRVGWPPSRSLAVDGAGVGHVRSMWAAVKTPGQQVGHRHAPARALRVVQSVTVTDCAANSAIFWRQPPQGGTGSGLSAMTRTSAISVSPAAHHRGDGPRLGAGAFGIGHVLDIAAGIDPARGRADRGADLEAGIGGIGVFANLGGGGEQGHGKPPDGTWSSLGPGGARYKRAPAVRQGGWPRP